MSSSSKIWCYQIVLTQCQNLVWSCAYEVCVMYLKLMRHMNECFMNSKYKNVLRKKLT